MNSCINGENCAGLPCVYTKLFNFEIQKCDQILSLFSHCGSHILLKRNWAHVHIKIHCASYVCMLRVILVII